MRVGSTIKLPGSKASYSRSLFEYESSDVVAFSVELYSYDLGVSVFYAEFERGDDVFIDNLLPGFYNISCIGFDSEGNVACEGETDVLVFEGETSVASLILNLLDKESLWPSTYDVSRVFKVTNYGTEFMVPCTEETTYGKSFSDLTTYGISSGDFSEYLNQPGSYLYLEACDSDFDESDYPRLLANCGPVGYSLNLHYSEGDVCVYAGGPVYGLSRYGFFYAGLNTGDVLFFATDEGVSLCSESGGPEVTEDEILTSSGTVSHEEMMLFIPEFAE